MAGASASTSPGMMALHGSTRPGCPAPLRGLEWGDPMARPIPDEIGTLNHAWDDHRIRHKLPFYPGIMMSPKICIGHSCPSPRVVLHSQAYSNAAWRGHGTISRASGEVLWGRF